MSINVAIIKKFVWNLQFLDQFLHTHEYLNFQYFEKLFGLLKLNVRVNFDAKIHQFTRTSCKWHFLHFYKVKLRLNAWSRIFERCFFYVSQQREKFVANDTFDRRAIMTLFIGTWNILTNAFSSITFSWFEIYTI